MDTTATLKQNSHTILIVDDNPTNLGVLSGYLEGYGFAILVSRDGAGALARAEYARPDLILLDVMMPGLNGFETCERLKLNAATSDIPVIFMTALSSTDDKVRGFTAGAVDYVTKPLQQEEVLARVNAHLRIRDLTRSLQTQNQQLQDLTGQLQVANDEITRFNQELEAMVVARTEELQRAYERLELLDRNKSDFIQVVSHELRTPMAIFSGYSQLLLDYPTIVEDPRLLQIMTAIHKSSEQLRAIVNTMLDVALIDSGLLALEYAPVQLAEVLEAARALYAGALEQRRLTLTFTGAEALPDIPADRAQLLKVFENLLSNAIKYTPDGGRIEVVGRLRDTEPCVELVFRDEGIGVDPQFHDLIFTKFYHTGRVDLHSTGRTKFKGGGPGLGLALVKGIVVAHGGQVWMESPGYDEDRCPGSQFHVLLPCRPPEPPCEEGE